MAIILKDVKVSDLRSHIGYVPQKGKLFKGTIMSNLTFAQKKKDVKLIEKACKISEAMEIVNEKIKKAVDDAGDTNLALINKSALPKGSIIMFNNADKIPDKW